MDVEPIHGIAVIVTYIKHIHLGSNFEDEVSEICLLEDFIKTSLICVPHGAQLLEICTQHHTSSVLETRQPLATTMIGNIDLQHEEM